MLRRLFALLLVTALVLAGLYYWKYRATGRMPELGEVGRQLGDTRITGEVKAALSLNRTVKPYAIDVATEDGVVSLRGDVATEEARAAAERVAAAVPDVRQVVNHLKVAEGATAPTGRDRTLGEALDDHALEVQVHLAFTLHRGLKGTDIGIKAFRRAVTLSGEVGAPRQRQLAVDLARQVDGVEDVKDEMRLAGGVATAGRRAVVERALAANPNLKPYAIQVREEGGRIVLAGRVRSGAEKDLAGLVAKEAAGGPVDNALDIGP